MDCYEIFKVIAEISLSVVAIGISIIALIQTNRQIKLSNKHQLFNIRLEKYTVVSSLFNVYTLARRGVDFKFAFDTAIDTILDLLVLDSSLKELVWINKSDKKIEDLKMIHNKSTNLIDLSSVIPVIFEGEESKLVADFIDSLNLLLVSMLSYKYMSKTSKSDTYNEENERIRKAVTDNFYNTEKTYDMVCRVDAINDLLKQIEL